MLNPEFPRPVAGYPDLSAAGLLEVLKERVSAEPFNLVATLLFVLAIVHTFLAPAFLRMSHRVEQAHQKRLAQQVSSSASSGASAEASFFAQILHFMGEIEAVFGI